MSIFTRILLACLLPLIIIFSAIVILINAIVSAQTTAAAEDRLENIAVETARQIDDRFMSAKSLLEVMNEFLSEFDNSIMRADRIAENRVKSMLESAPYIHSVWFSFEPYEFAAGKRFTRYFVRADNEIKSLNEFYNTNVLHDPVSAPWYYNPFRTGKLWFETADFYDYQTIDGRKYIGTVSAPIIRKGMTVGVSGIDLLYENTFAFIDKKQIRGEQLILVLTDDGRIIYAPNAELVNKSIFDMQFENRHYVQSALSRDTAFNIQDISPFFGVKSKIYFYPIVSLPVKSKQLYLYIDLPTSSLLSDAEYIAHIMVSASVVGLVLFTVILLFTVRSILKPIKKLTKSASMITNRDVDIKFDMILNAELSEDKKRTRNEFYTLFAALRNMGESIAMTEKYKAMSTAKSDFLAKMSHEIRTPMNAITGMAELALRENISPPAAREHVLTIKQASANLLSIINDILDLSKIESGKLEIVPVEYHVASLVNDVVSIIRTRVIDSPVRFTVSIDSNIPCVLFGDEVRVRQILLNVLNNAVKYTKNGSITLAICGRNITDTMVTLNIEVTDTGNGIKKEDIGKLFSNFAQVDIESNRGIEGTGLGLVITKNLATAMNGDITVESEYGKGSKFTVTLPQKIRSREPVAKIEYPHEKSALIYDRNDAHIDSLKLALNDLGIKCDSVRRGEDLSIKLKNNDYTYIFAETALYENAKNIVDGVGSKAQFILLADFGDNAAADTGLSVIAMPVYSITVANTLNCVAVGSSYHTNDNVVIKFSAPDAMVLVVDDIKTNLEVARGLLSPYEMIVDTCLSGAEAIAMVKQHSYDLILMDHMMPEMDGLEATMKIREMGNGYARIPIVALTANAVAGTKEMLLQNGFDDFLSKPIDTAKMNAVLEKWIPKDKQEAAVTKRFEVSEVIADISIDGVDVKAGLARVGGSVSAYLRTLSVFSGDGSDKIDEIRKYLANDDMPQFTICVHALKGAAANIGAVAFSEAANVLELAGKRKDTAFVKKHIDRFIASLETLTRGIDAALGTAKEKQTSNGQKTDRDTIKKTLVSLNEAIDSFDIDAINKAAGELRQLAGIGGEVENILQKTLIGDHDEAVTLIEKLLERKA